MIPDSEPGRLRELAERCEAASGPDRSLDAAIHEALGHCVHDMRIVRVEVEPGEYDAVLQCQKCGDYKGAAPSAYTASIDAALKLLPEAWDGALYLAAEGAKPCVQLETPDMRARWATSDEQIDVSANTLPLALAAACLRARASQEG